jgi:hypothetical protein
MISRRDPMARGSLCRGAMTISTLHEALVLLFHNRLSLAVELLQIVLKVPLPAFHDLHLEPNEVGGLKPIKHRADLVLSLRDPHKKRLRAVVVEVQLGIDDDKRESWPIYVVNLRGKLHCDVTLLVVTIRASVARWAARPIDLGHPGFALRPLVLGPNAIPILTQLERARRAPELAVLSATAHGQGAHGVAIARAAFAALDALSEVDAERATVYHDVIDLHLNAAAKSALEEMMETKWEYQSNFAKKYIGIGRAEGKAEGELAGEARGEARGKAEGVLAVLEARGVEVPERVRAAVLGCTDLEQLDAWLRRAVSVEDASALL